MGDAKGILLEHKRNDKLIINVVIFIAVAIAAYFIYKNKFSPVAKDRDFLHNLGFGVADRMTDQEVIAAATYIRDYTQKGKRPAPGSALATMVNYLHNKYKIF